MLKPLTIGAQYNNWQTAKNSFCMRRRHHHHHLLDVGVPRAWRGIGGLESAKLKICEIYKLSVEGSMEEGRTEGGAEGRAEERVEGRTDQDANIIIVEVNNSVKRLLAEEVLSAESVNTVYEKHETIVCSVMIPNSIFKKLQQHPCTMDRITMLTAINHLGETGVFIQRAPNFFNMQLALDTILAYRIYDWKNIVVTMYEHHLWKAPTSERRRLATIVGFPPSSDVQSELERRKIKPAIALTDFIRAMLVIASIKNSLPDTPVSALLLTMRDQTKPADWTNAVDMEPYSKPPLYA